MGARAAPGDSVMIARKKLHCVVRYYYSDICIDVVTGAATKGATGLSFFFSIFSLPSNCLLEFVKRETELEKRVNDFCWTLSGPPATAYLMPSSLTSDSRVDCQLSGGK